MTDTGPSIDRPRGQGDRSDHGRDDRRRQTLLSRRSLLCGTGAAVAGSTVLGSGRGAAQSDGDDVVFNNGFESKSLGTYTPTSAEWNGHSLEGNSEEPHLAVIDAGGNRVLDAIFPEGIEGAGNQNGGGDFQVGLGGTYDELYLGYRIKFNEGFEFSQPGGKLPGLIGTMGEEYAITGGDDPDGTNGWSARMMWRDPDDPSDGGLVNYYVYHPDQPGTYGHDMHWDDGPGGQVYFKRGQWHRIEHRVKMNTPGENDGVLEGWFDGEKAFERRDLRFRDISELGIDDFYFSSFFGGGQTEHWAHTREEHIYFDDFVVSTTPIWSGDMTAPTVPGDLQATGVGATTVDVSWSASTDDSGTGIAGYHLYADDLQVGTVSGSTTQATVDGVPADSTVDIAVTAVDHATNESDPATITVTTDPIDDSTPPPAPSSLDVEDWYFDGVSLAWTGVEDVGAAGLSHYNVYVDGERQTRVSAGTTGHRVSGLARGTTYEFGVSAVDLGGNESSTATISANTLSVDAGDDALVVHDFESGLWPDGNKLGNWAGADSFENGGGTGEVIDGTLRLEYDDAGWLKSNIDGKDLSEYTHLSVILRGDAGGEHEDIEVELGGTRRPLEELSTQTIGTSMSAVRVAFADVGSDGSDITEFYLRFNIGGTGAVEIHEIRFEHDDPGGGGDPALPEVDGSVTQDLNGDGLHRDLNGNGRLDNDDVVTYFEHMNDDAVQNNVDAFDYNGNGRIDFDDIVTLFESL